MRKKVVWCPIDRQTASSFEMSRDVSTPMITGQRPEDEAQTEEDMEEVEGAVLAEEISRDAGEFFDQTVSSVDGRKKFQNWLFTMTDTNNDQIVQEEELLVMIRALRHDGISPEDLTYDPERLLKDAAKSGDGSEEDQDRYFAKQLLHEYDVEARGYLSPTEFQVLASLIVKNYELRHEYLDNPEQQIRLQGFRLARRLGKGANGEVRLAVDLKTGARKAVKIVPKRDMAHLSSLDTEITAMMILKHRHIVNLDQVQEDDQNVFFIMELCGGGNISDYLDGKPISETLARFYFQQIVDGVAYCHLTGVAHRDLKLDNILLDNNANIKITDFGHAGIYKSGWDVFQTPLVGGLCHLAPEQILNQSYSGEKHDVWSLGVILFVLLSGHSPFTSHHPQQLLDDIKSVRYEMPSHLSDEAKSLISRMLVADSADRLSISQVSKHAWMCNTDVDAPLLNSFTLPVPSGFWKRYSCTSESMCHVLKLMDIEPVYNASTIQNVADEHMDVRCHWPAKDVRFSFKVKAETEDGTQLLEFRLATGASREFLSLMTKLKSTIAQRIRRNRKQDGINNPLLKKGSGVGKDSSARSSPTAGAGSGSFASKNSSHSKEGSASASWNGNNYAHNGNGSHFDEKGSINDNRISDDLNVEDDGSLRPQIVSLAELHQIEAAIAAEARADEKKISKKSLRKRKGENHLDRSPESTDSETETPNTYSSHQSASNIAAPTPHRSGHGHRQSSSSKHGANHALLASSNHSNVLSSGDDIRRSRSVPNGATSDDAPAEGRPSTATSHRHGSDHHHHNGDHHKDHMGSHHASSRKEKAKESKNSEKESSSHIHLHMSHRDKLSSSSASNISTRDTDSAHHERSSDLNHSHSTVASTSRRSKRSSEVPVSILASSAYVPGQVMTSMPGLVAWGQLIASEPYTKPIRRKKIRSSSTTISGAESGEIDASTSRKYRGKTSKVARSSKTSKTRTDEVISAHQPSDSLPTPPMSHHSISVKESAHDRHHSTTAASQQQPRTSHASQRSHHSHMNSSAHLKSSTMAASGATAKKRSSSRSLEHSCSTCSCSTCSSYSDSESSASSGSGSSYSSDEWSDTESSARTPRRARQSFEASPCSSRASSRGRTSKSRKDKDRSAASAGAGAKERSTSRSRSRKASIASRAESPSPPKHSTKDHTGNVNPISTHGSTAASRGRSKDSTTSPSRTSKSKRSSPTRSISSASIVQQSTSSKSKHAHASSDQKEQKDQKESKEYQSSKRDSQQSPTSPASPQGSSKHKSERDQMASSSSPPLLIIPSGQSTSAPPPAPPNTTPAKPSKSFKRSKTTSKKSSGTESQSLPVSPKRRDTLRSSHSMSASSSGSSSQESSSLTASSSSSSVDSSVSTSAAASISSQIFSHSSSSPRSPNGSSTPLQSSSRSRSNSDASNESPEGALSGSEVDERASMRSSTHAGLLQIPPRSSSSTPAYTASSSRNSAAADVPTTKTKRRKSSTRSASAAPSKRANARKTPDSTAPNSLHATRSHSPHTQVIEESEEISSPEASPRRRSHHSKANATTNTSADTSKGSTRELLRATTSMSESEEEESDAPAARRGHSRRFSYSNSSSGSKKKETSVGTSRISLDSSKETSQKKDKITSAKSLEKESQKEKRKSQSSSKHSRKASTDKADKIERSDRSEKHEKPEKSEKTEKSDRKKDKSSKSSSTSKQKGEVSHSDRIDKSSHKSHSADKLEKSEKIETKSKTSSTASPAPPTTSSGTVKKSKVSKSAHHSPEDSSSSEESEGESKSKSANHRKNLSLGHIEAPETQVSTSSKKHRHSQKVALEATRERSDEEDESDSDSPTFYYKGEPAERTQSLTSLSASKSSKQASSHAKEAATAAPTASHASNVKRSKSFKKERTKERSKAHDAKSNKHLDTLEDS